MLGVVGEAEAGVEQQRDVQTDQTPAADVLTLVWVLTVSRLSVRLHTAARKYCYNYS